MVYMCILSLAYQRLGYIKIVGRAANHSMMGAVETVKELQNIPPARGGTYVYQNGYSTLSCVQL